jgi:hypothetical protein
MSDVRVPDEKEHEMAKRRPGAHGFKDLYATQGHSSTGATPYGLMSDFLGEAFEDGKLDDNELAGMKVLAGLAPRPQPTPAPAAQQPSPQPAPAPSCNDESCEPSPATEGSSLPTQVGAKLDESKDWDSGEQRVLQLAQRLWNASLKQQDAFMEEMCRLMRDGDMSSSDASRLDGFVDGLFSKDSGSSGKQTPRSGSGTENGRYDVVRDFLSEAMSNGTISDAEWQALMALLSQPTTTPVDSNRYEPQPVRAEPAERRFDPSTTQAARASRWIDEMVASGGISYETGERAKRGG